MAVLSAAAVAVDVRSAGVIDTSVRPRLNTAIKLATAVCPSGVKNATPSNSAAKAPITHAGRSRGNRVPNASAGRLADPAASWRCRLRATRCSSPGSTGPKRCTSPARCRAVSTTPASPASTSPGCASTPLSTRSIAAETLSARSRSVLPSNLFISPAIQNPCAACAARLWRPRHWRLKSKIRVTTQPTLPQVRKPVEMATLTRFVTRFLRETAPQPAGG